MLKTASKLIHKWRRYASSKCYKIDENVRFWIWWSAMAPSDAAENKKLSWCWQICATRL